jgi:hypothetical protein
MCQEVAAIALVAVGAGRPAKSAQIGPFCISDLLMKLDFALKNVV